MAAPHPAAGHRPAGWLRPHKTARTGQALAEGGAAAPAGYGGAHGWIARSRDVVMRRLGSAASWDPTMPVNSDVVGRGRLVEEDTGPGSRGISSRPRWPE